MTDRRMNASQTVYHIRLAGSLDARWSDWFEDFVMASRDGGETLLTGVVVDQAALHGVLGKIRGIGLPLSLVLKSGCPCTSKNCPRRANCSECAAHHAASGKLPYCLRPGTKWDRRCDALVEVN